MQKINFQNLPSTTTPLNATNMNAIQTNVENVFNGSVPAGSMVVDSIRSKNMFNKNNIANGSFTDTGEIISSTTIFYEVDYIEVKANTKYTFSTTSNVDRLVVCEYNSSKTFIQRDITTNSSTYTITTTANTKYVRLCSVLSAIDTLQFEEGQTRTTYSPYQNLTGDVNFVDGHRIWIGTKVLTFSNGQATWDITEFGLSSKPRCIVLTSNSSILAMQYDYDNSTSTSAIIKLSGQWNGAYRFSYILTT